MNALEINERSYGVVPLMIQGGIPYVFIIQHVSGAWLFPKGHAEPGETDHQAAERELAEETGLYVQQWLDHEPFVENYEFCRGTKKIHKEATYFPALASGEIRLQSSEVKDGRWTPTYDAVALVTFPEMKDIVQQVHTWISSSL